MSMMRPLSAVAALLTLAACASTGPASDPVGRSLTWFSYLNGEDLRPRCSSGAAEHYRMVFNADYSEHVRTYEVTGDPGNGGAEIEARVIKAADLSRVDLSNPMAAWKAEVARTRLSAEQFAQFVVELYRSGAFQRDGERLHLPSNGFYWLVAGCRAGQWFFTAYPYPSDRFAEIRFVAPLQAYDRTGVPFPTLPPAASAPQSLPSAGRQKEGGTFFEITVSGDGLVGPTHLFGPWPERLSALLTPR